MKIAVTRPSPLGPLAARPLVIDTDDLPPADAARLEALAAAAGAEGDNPAPDRPQLGVRIDIDAGDAGRIILHQAEGRLTPAAADLVDAVSALARR